MVAAEVLRESDIIFPLATSSLRDTLGELKRSNLSIANRLRSIQQDAEFVRKVAHEYKLPLIANERCGAWYVPPDRKAGSVYFKSTDGHFGQWSFSLRRLNIQMFDVIGQNGGCIIVDSTRRGKSMPDALSKTIPIWIAVWNLLLFPGQNHSRPLRTPEDVVSRSEQSQIENHLSQFVQEAKALNLELNAFRQKLGNKPMHPIFIKPGARLPLKMTLATPDTHLVILCTASSSASTERHDSHGYVQGAADDSESWACGLDAPTFWRCRDELLSTSEDDLPAVVESLMAQAGNRLSPMTAPIRVTGNMWISNDATADQVSGFDVRISCAPNISTILVENPGSQSIHLACSGGKIGSRQLRTELPKIEELARLIHHDSRILVSCERGKDLAVGVALAIACLFFQDDGTLRPIGIPPALSKSSIKQRLSWIMVSVPDAAPSRATLQSVNAFLMG